MLTSTTHGTSYPDKDDCSVSVLTPEDVPKVWGRAKELIAKQSHFQTANGRQMISFFRLSMERCSYGLPYLMVS